MKTLTEALRALPPDSRWSSSFGNPGEGGFTEFWRTPAGDVWEITNGAYDLPSFMLDWKARPVPRPPPRPGPATP